MDELYDLCKSLSYGLAKKYAMVEREDISQEIVVYAVSHFESYPDPSLEPAEFRKELAALKKRLRKAGDKYCRIEKAAKVGYEVEDECFYSLNRLKELVETYYQVGIEEKPPIEGDSVRRSSDGSEAGTWISSLLDVERGLTLISFANSYRLRHRYKLNARMDDSAYAASQGLTPDQLKGRLRTSLRALQRALGGANPWNRGPAPRGTEG